LEIYQTDDLRKWIGIYLHACRSRNLAAGTIEFYGKKLNAFTQFCLENNVVKASQINADLIRQFLISLDEWGHRPAISTLRRLLRSLENTCSQRHHLSDLREAGRGRPYLSPIFIVNGYTNSARRDCEVQEISDENRCYPKTERNLSPGTGCARTRSRAVNDPGDGEWNLWHGSAYLSGRIYGELPGHSGA
jgi:hypothetical protein